MILYSCCYYSLLNILSISRSFLPLISSFHSTSCYYVPFGLSWAVPLLSILSYVSFGPFVPSTLWAFLRSYCEPSSRIGSVFSCLFVSFLVRPGWILVNHLYCSGLCIVSCLSSGLWGWALLVMVVYSFRIGPLLVSIYCWEVVLFCLWWCSEWCGPARMMRLQSSYRKSRLPTALAVSTLIGILSDRVIIRISHSHLTFMSAY